MVKKEQEGTSLYLNKDDKELWTSMAKSDGQSTLIKFLRAAVNTHAAINGPVDIGVVHTKPRLWYLDQFSELEGITGIELIKNILDTYIIDQLEKGQSDLRQMRD
jgi:hypothetical protein